MPKAADKKEELDTDLMSPEKDSDLGPKKESGPEEKDEGAEKADADAPAGAQNEEAAGKKQVEPRIHIVTPNSGDAYPLRGKLPITVECEGEGKFNAELNLRNGKGKSVASIPLSIDLGTENKGTGEFEIDLDKAIGHGHNQYEDTSGTYQLHAFGTDGSGKEAPMSRINIDLIDEENADAPNMPKDVANAPPEKPE
jgi:hypothetical protein